MKKFYLHYSGLKVARDGEVWVPKSGKWPEHYTYGYASGSGHMRVAFQGVEYKIQTLVAEVFLNDNKPIHKGYDVHHINEVKDDNRVENLLILTHEEHTVLHHKGKHYRPNIPIIGVHKVTGEIREFESAKDAARVLGIKQGHITECCRGIRKSAGGWKWEYKCA